MTETHLSTAVRAAINQWMQETSPEQQKVQLSNPAYLSVTLGKLVEKSLEDQGYNCDDVRAYVLNSSHCHLKTVFNATTRVNTPNSFIPVPDDMATIVGRAAALAMHGLLRLETVSYLSENQGYLFVNLVALPGEGAFAEKSKKGMRGHTDAVSFPFNRENDPEYQRIAPSPDFVTLIGLRNPNCVSTRFMSLEDVMERLSSFDIKELEKPQFSILAQRTFRQGTENILGVEHMVVNAPVLKCLGDDMYIIRYSHSSVTTDEDNHQANRALRSLEDACNACANPVVVQPGDVLLVSNRLALHGRSEVGDEVGGQSRWLLRTYGLDTSDLQENKRHYPRSVRSHMLFP